MKKTWFLDEHGKMRLWLLMVICILIMVIGALFQ